MAVRVAIACAFVAASTLAAHCQTFTPAERQLLMQPTTIGAAPGTFTPPAKAEKTKSGKRDAKPVSIASELNGTGTGPGGSAPTLRKPREVAGQMPFDQRVPFGPLSLGLQAEAAPRSDSLTTPVPDGMNQFKKDRADPYVGVSIIDIKR